MGKTEVRSKSQPVGADSWKLSRGPFWRSRAGLIQGAQPPACSVWGAHAAVSTPGAEVTGCCGKCPEPGLPGSLPSFERGCMAGAGSWVSGPGLGLRTLPPTQSLPRLGQAAELCLRPPLGWDSSSKPLEKQGASSTAQLPGTSSQQSMGIAPDVVTRLSPRLWEPPILRAGTGFWSNEPSRVR